MPICLSHSKSMQVVPCAKDFIDIVLSKTQRGTPTVVHNGWAILRIRQLYVFTLAALKALLPPFPHHFQPLPSVPATTLCPLSPPALCQHNVATCARSSSQHPIGTSGSPLFLMNFQRCACTFLSWLLLSLSPIQTQTPLKNVCLLSVPTLMHAACSQVEDIHPFYGDLLNVLYDKDHYKLALGQLNTARSLIDRLAQGSCYKAFFPQSRKRRLTCNTLDGCLAQVLVCRQSV